ncbi:hypothetical protein AMS68_004170 [Peltaster fructicola]|uniref:Myb-like domain-containing protein n=1 Tax=Peltaster fructicola TaxID=286661 RepID=A0A6H0XV84_9PEZI|nr:hypothetical protein AMS68_004170 [Peltaster fructicola]
MEGIEYTSTQPSNDDGTKSARAPRGAINRWTAVKDQYIALAAVEAFSRTQDLKVWDDIGSSMDPPTKGNAIMQHFAKVRQALEAAGLDVPPHKNPNHVPRPRTETSPHPTLLPIGGSTKKKAPKQLAADGLRTLQSAALRTAPVVPSMNTEVDEGYTMDTSENSIGWRQSDGGDLMEMSDVETSLDHIADNLAALESSMPSFSQCNY